MSGPLRATASPSKPGAAAFQTPAKLDSRSINARSFMAAETPLKTPCRTPGGIIGEQTSQTPIINFDAIEAQKENVQPLARGRSAHALSNTLGLQHREREATLAAQRREHEAAVHSEANADSDDPLEAWISYVNWCIDNYPSGQSHESGLILLLEQATRTFRSSEQYRHDSRYLRLWVLYARNVESPQHVFNFLLAQEIGTNLAGLYEELAVVYETQSCFDKADETYRLGINRSAQPLERLRRRYAEYQSRILTGRSAGPSAGPTASYSAALAEAMAQARRSMLGTKVGSGPGAPSLGANSMRGLGAASGLGSGGGSTRQPLVNNGKKLGIYQDKENDAGVQGGRIEWGGSLGSSASRRQENAPEAKAWKDQRLPQKPGMATTTPKKGSLQIFRDSDDEDDEGRASAMSPSKDVFSRPAAKQPTESEMLRKNPFLKYDKDVKLEPSGTDIAEAAAPPAAPSRRSGEEKRDHRDVKDRRERKERKEKESNKSRSKSSASGSTSSSRPHASASSSSAKVEKLAVPLELLYPGFTAEELAAPRCGLRERRREGANEVCFEELLARRRGVPTEASSTSDPWAHLDVVQGRWLPEPEPVAEPEPRPQPQPQTAISDHERNRRREPTMTLVTKAAMAEVAEMFNDDDDDDDSDDSDDDSDDDDDEDDEEQVAPPPPAPVEQIEVVSPAPLVETNVIPPSSDPPVVEEEEGEEAQEFSPAPLVFNALSSSAVLSTPIRKPHQARPLNLGRRDGATSDGAKAQRVDAFNVLEDDDEEEEDNDDDLPDDRAQRRADQAAAAAAAAAASGLDPWGEHNFHALTPITERTEFTRFTMAARTPGSTTRMTDFAGGAARKSIGANLTAQSHGNLSLGGAPLLEERMPSLPSAPSVAEKAFVASPESTEVVEPVVAAGPPMSQSNEARSPLLRDDRSIASSHDETNASADDLEDPSEWGRRASFNLEDGLTIARAEGDRTGQVVSERLGDSFTIEEQEGEEEDEELTKTRNGIGATALSDAQAPVKAQGVPNPCSPADRRIVESLLASLPRPIEAEADYVDLSGQESDASAKLETLMKRAKSNLRKSMSSTSLSASTGGSAGGANVKAWGMNVGGHHFGVRTLLGEGGFGAVFLAEDVDGCVPRIKPTSQLDEEEDEEEEDDDDDDESRLVAIKVESPPNRWEFYVLRQLQERIPEGRMRRSFISARGCFVNSDQSFLTLDYGAKGTLLEIVNNATKAGVVGAGGTGGGSGASGVEEVLAMFFVIELLGAVRAMHGAGIIHGDLKIDNCLVRLDEQLPGQPWSNAYAPDGKEGWGFAGLTLIDFGRAIDLSLFPPGQRFKADWPADEGDCLEMRKGESFTFETDYHGCASIAYCLLFGKYMSTTTTTVESSGEERQTIDQPMKRYWQGELWTKFFDLMLNPRRPSPASASGGKEQERPLPLGDELKELQEEMQAWLVDNSRKAGKNLKGLVKKLQVYAEIRTR